MRHIFTFAVVLIFLLSASSCNFSANPLLNATTLNDEPQLKSTSLTDIIPNLDGVTNVSVYTFGGIVGSIYNDENNTIGIYAPASEVQTQRILSILMLYADTEYVETDLLDENLLSTPYVLIENELGSSVFSFIASVDDNSVFYISLFPVQKKSDILAGEEILPLRFFKGRSGAFPIRDYYDALIEVLSDTKDSRNVAVVQLLSSDEQYTLSKSNTAVLRYLFDSAMHYNGAIEYPEECCYDIKIIIDMTIYFIDSLSGYFSEESGGVIKLGKFDENSLQHFFTLV